MFIPVFPPIFRPLNGGFDPDCFSLKSRYSQIGAVLAVIALITLIIVDPLNPGILDDSLLKILRVAIYFMVSMATWLIWPVVILVLIISLFL